MKTFTLKDFDPEEPSTTGVAPEEHQLGLSTIRFWDMNGLVMKSSTTKLNYDCINVCLFIFDVTEKNTFEWLRPLLEMHVLEQWTYTLLVCNKMDLVDEQTGDPDLRAVTEEEMNELCEDFGINAVIEVSAYSELRIHEAVADSVLKSDQLKYMAPPKKKGCRLNIKR